MHKLSQTIKNYGTEIALVTGAFVLLFLLLWFRLGSLTYGRAAPVEIASQQAAHTWHAIAANPLFGPYTVVQRLAIMSGHHGLTSMRAVSTLFAIAAIVLFYFVARQWHSMRVAVLATWLFISSSWFLHTARLATPEILWLVSILGLVVLFSPRRGDKHSRLVLPLMTVSLGAMLYVPAMVWLVALSLILRRKNIQQYWNSADNFVLRGISIIIGLALLAPLIRALVINPDLIQTWAGFSTPFDAPTIMLKHFLSVPKQLFISGPATPVHWLGHLPLLSVFEIVMFILGAYFYVSHLKAARSQFIITLSLLAWILIGVGGIASLSLIVPVIYLVLTTGIAYMLHEWLKVFPRNPVARGIGIAVIAVAILLTSLYQTRSYFVAWHYSPPTRAAFNQKM